MENTKPLSINSAELIDTSIQPFRIAIPQIELDDLHNRNYVV